MGAWRPGELAGDIECRCRVCGPPHSATRHCAREQSHRRQRRGDDDDDAPAARGFKELLLFAQHEHAAGVTVGPSADKKALESAVYTTRREGR